jgi:hypothetical protein
MNSNEYGQAEGLDNIDYYLDKLEYSVRHLIDILYIYK